MYVRPKGLPIAPSALKVNFPTFNLLSRFQEFAIKYTTGGRRSNQYVVQAKLTRTRVISKTASPEAGCGICRQIASIESGGGFNQSLHRSSKATLMWHGKYQHTHLPLTALNTLRFANVLITIQFPFSTMSVVLTVRVAVVVVGVVEALILYRNAVIRQF